MMQTPNPTNPLEHNNRGVEYGSKGMWQQAVQEHELALSGDPWNMTFRQNLSAAYLKYGQSLLSKGQMTQAAEKLRYAIYIDPENRAADEYLNTAIKGTHKDPDNAAVRLNLAEDFDAAGDYVQAIAEYRHYVRMKDSGEAHWGLGKVLVKQGRVVPIKMVEGFKELKIALTKSWEVNEKNDQALCHSQLGDILKEMAEVAKDNNNADVAMKRLINAGVEYRRAVTLNPLSSDAIRGLIEVARIAVSINPSFDNHLMLAGAYQLMPDFEHARHEYEECYKINPHSTVLSQARRSFHLAVVSSSQASQPMIAASMQKVEEQLRQTPNDAELLYIYGRGKEGQGDKQAAILAYQAAARINPNVHPQLQPRLAALLGGGSIGNGPVGVSGAPAKPMSAGPEGKLGGPAIGGPPSTAVPGATGVASAAGVGAPAAAAAPKTANYAPFEAMMNSGKLDEAIKGLTDIIDKNPQDAHAWLLLGSASEKNKDLDAASANYRQAQALGEKSAQSELDRVNKLRIAPMLEESDKAVAAKNFVAAASSLRDALSLDPTNASLHRKLSGICKQMGDSAEADKEDKRAADLEGKGGK
jgi:tetratricopeptide (TPR) repeat protein